MSVQSSQNKHLLWQLLSNHPNQKSNPKKFQHLLEYRVTQMHKNRFKYNNDLMLMNKEVIKQFANEIPPPPTGAGIQQASISKTDVFNKKLKIQQDNFNTLINKQKPAEIDFSDKNEDTPIDARMVDTTLQAREEELKKIMSQYNKNDKAKEWLSSASTSTTNHLKIDNESNVKIQPTILTKDTSERRVRFEVEEETPPTTTTIDFLQKLKKTKGKEDELLSYLKRIESKQDIIINLLKTTN